MEGWNLTGTSSGSFIDFANAMADSEAAGQSAAGKDTDALSVSQAVEMAANALDAIPQLTVIGEVTVFAGPTPEAVTAIFKSRTMPLRSIARFGAASTQSVPSIYATAEGAVYRLV